MAYCFCCMQIVARFYVDAAGVLCCFRNRCGLERSSIQLAADHRRPNEKQKQKQKIVDVLQSFVEN